MRAILIAAVLAASAAAAQAQTPAPAPTFDPSAVFKQFDTNGDGAIDKDEWAAAGRPPERFTAIDANKDEKVSLEELTVAIRQMMQARPAG
jgi:hypothetical protein